MSGNDLAISVKPTLPDVECGHNSFPGSCDSSESPREDLYTPGKGINVTFKDITFSIPSNKAKGETAYLLRGVSGFFSAGQLVALLGPSGSGKTTLLDILSGRKTVGKVEGGIRFGGGVPSKAFLQRYTGVVEQFDTLIGSLTVEEMLMYTACLKRPVEESREDKQRDVDSLLGKLGLGACRGVRIGDDMHKGISGGQAKRTNIGIALISNPRVLFLDEPTSGLDSFTADEVMTLVRSLATGGTSICATIHSPSAYTFSLFDSVMVLLQGRAVYFGPGGAPAVAYAQSYWQYDNGRTTLQTDAELLVSLITEADRRGDTQALADQYAGSQLRKDNDAEMARMLGAPAMAAAGTPAASASSQPAPGALTGNSGTAAAAAGTAKAGSASELLVRSSTSTPWWNQLLTLLRYRTSYNYRNPAWLGPRIMDKLIFSIIIVTLYLGIGDDFSSNNMVNMSASLFMWCTLPAFGAASYVPSIILERRLFVRERADGLYSVLSYLVSKIMEEVVLAAFTSLFFSSFVFYGIQYQGSFGLFWIVYFVTLCNGIVLAYLIAALSPNMDVANAALPAYVTTLLFFAGQLMTFTTMPAWWSWYSYIDFLRYSWGALMLNQFEDHDVVWTQDDQTILQYFGLQGVDKSAYCGYNSLFFLAFFVLAYLALSYVSHHKR